MLKKKIIACLVSLLFIFTVQVGAVETASNDIIPFAEISTYVETERDITDVVDTAKLYPHYGFNWSYVAQYETEPSFTAPYSAGSIQQQYIDDALNALKMVRYLAYVPYENIEFTDELNNISQHGAVLMAATNQFTHFPIKTDSAMEESFFDLGYLGCSEANISAGVNNLAGAVLGFVADEGSNNLDRAGHRRWILRPNATEFGIGYAQYDGASYGGNRISMHVFEDGLGTPQSYVAWPSEGAFPLEYFQFDSEINYENWPSYYPNGVSYPWSINLGSEYQAPSKNNLEITLTRESDGEVWVFDKNTPALGDSGEYFPSGMHLSVDDDGYGMKKAITFRPDLDSLGFIEDGDVFNVSVSGLYTSSGQPTTLEYDIDFFSLETEIQRSEIQLRVQNNDTAIPNAKITIDGQVYQADINGVVTLRLDNYSNIPFTVEADGFVTKTDSFNTADFNGFYIINMESDAVSGSLGDINGDGRINNVDVVTLINYISDSQLSIVLEHADIDENGTINNLDVLALFAVVSTVV